jgi:transcriptional regulator with XRE-family HTH domain
VANRANQDARQQNLVEALRAARKALHLSQTELAERLGKRQQFVSKYESGERRLDFIEVLDVAKILGLTAESLLINIGEGDE